jgi:hypothetical protein
MAGLCELAACLQAPIFGVLREPSTIVSGGYLKNSRFWETRTGDRVRSALPGLHAPELAHNSCFALSID